MAETQHAAAHRGMGSSRRLRHERSRRLAGRALLYLPLVAWGLITAYPFFWTLITSLRTQPDLYARPFALPAEWRWENYVVAWRTAHVGRYMLNSAYSALISTLLALALSATSAFVLSRFTFRFRSLLWGYVLLGLLVPSATRLVPLAILSRKLGLYDSLLGLATVYAAQGVPFNVLLLASFMETIPRELEEAAVMDGASMSRVFRNVILPLSQPALATTATFHVLYSWNEYILAALLLASEANRTLPLGIRAILGQFRTDFPGFAAGMVLSIIPAVLFFLLLQRYVVKGVSAGAMQGV